MVPCDTQRSLCRFLGHSTQTDCGRCSIDPRIYHPAKRSLAMCEHTGGVLADFVLVFHRDICREHNLIGRRNYLMTEAPNSLSAARARIYQKLQQEPYRQAIFGLGHGRARLGSGSACCGAQVPQQGERRQNGDCIAPRLSLIHI